MKPYQPKFLDEEDEDRLKDILSNFILIKGVDLMILYKE